MTSPSLLLPVAMLATAAIVAGPLASSDARPAKAPVKATVKGAGETASPRRAIATHPTKVLVVIEENHSRAEMQKQMPYLAALSRKYGYATRWRALRHPSLPNYIAIAGGSTFGIADDKDPSVNSAKIGNARSVFGQARRAGKSVGTFAQSMPAPCTLVTRGAYAVRHNPWTYFASERAACRRGDISTASFGARARANTLPDLGFLIPDVKHDAHDGSLATADSWLKQRLRPVLASSDFTSGRLAVVVTADEDDRSAGNVVLTSVLATQLHHKVVRKALNHYSLTRFIDQILGMKPLRKAATAPDMKAAFGL